MKDMKMIKAFILGVVVFIPLAFIGLLIFALIGPRSVSITTKELIGKYNVSLPDDGKEILELLPDEICKQDIFLKDGSVYSAIGKWKYIKLDGWDYLSLEGTRLPLAQFSDRINPNIAEIPKGGTGGLPISRTLMGNITIERNENHYYKKIN